MAEMGVDYSTARPAGAPPTPSSHWVVSPGGWTEDHA